MIATYMNGAIWAAIFHTAPIFPLGLGIVIMNCILMWFISQNILSLDPTSNLSYTGTNFIFNFLVFSIFSELVKGLLV